jgi:hypothetical protein
MKTKHNRINKNNIKLYKNTIKNRKINSYNKSKKWITALEAAQKTLLTTGSLSKAQLALKKQALFNARKLFGSVGKL